MILCEIYTPEVPERDDDTGVEGESDVPGLTYLAACMVDLSLVQGAKETVVKSQGLRYRQATLNVEMRVSEDAAESLPPGVALPRDLPLVLRLWDGSVLASSLQKTVDLEGSMRQGFDSWLSNLKLVTVDEALQRDAIEAIKVQAYELQAQQTDHLYPDIDKITFTNVDSQEKLARGLSVPSSPVLPRVRDAKLRPATKDVVRRLARPTVPTRPVTPLTYTQEEVDRMIERAVNETRERMQHRMDIERGKMMDQSDILSVSVREAAEEKRRFQAELDERSEALRKCGVEIMELRKVTKQQNADKAALQRALAEKEQLHSQMTVADEGLEFLDRGDLEKRLKLVAASYKDERSKSNERLVQMQKLHNDLTRMEELNRAHKALQEAHGVQSGKIQELQDKIKKLSKYVQTVQQQEKVIEQLERMMEKALNDAKDVKGIRDERDRVRKDLKQAQAERDAMRAQMGDSAAADAAKQVEAVEKMKAQIAQLEKELEAAKNALPKPDPAAAGREKKLQEELDKATTEKEDLEKKLRERPKGGDAMGEKERLMLLMRAEKAEARIKAVENQMTINSKKFAKEISGLKMRVMEKDAELANR